MDLASSRAAPEDLAKRPACVCDLPECDQVRRPVSPCANCCRDAYSSVHDFYSRQPYYKNYVRHAGSWHCDSYLVDDH